MEAMPARETESAQVETESTADIAPPQAAESAAQFSTEGDLPAVATVAAASAATASELAFDGQEKQAPQSTAHLDKGMHEWESYRAACHAAGKPEKWKDDYRNGYTSASQWKQPSESRSVNDFKLKKHQSASQALKDFIAGPTVTDYRAALLAVEINEVRDSLGDRKFDKLFGSANSAEDQAISGAQRLRISSDAYTTPLADQMKAIAAEYDAREHTPAEVAPPAVVEEKVAEKPKEAPIVEQDPVVVAQELGVEQRDREIV
jgi:hypothetical protein